MRRWVGLVFCWYRRLHTELGVARGPAYALSLALLRRCARFAARRDAALADAALARAPLACAHVAGWSAVRRGTRGCRRAPPASFTRSSPASGGVLLPKRTSAVRQGAPIPAVHNPNPQGLRRAGRRRLAPAPDAPALRVPRRAIAARARKPPPSRGHLRRGAPPGWQTLDHGFAARPRRRSAGCPAVLSQRLRCHAARLRASARRLRRDA